MEGTPGTRNSYPDEERSAHAPPSNSLTTAASDVPDWVRNSRVVSSSARGRRSSIPDAQGAAPLPPAALAASYRQEVRALRAESKRKRQALKSRTYRAKRTQRMLEYEQRATRAEQLVAEQIQQRQQLMTQLAAADQRCRRLQFLLQAQRRRRCHACGAPCDDSPFAPEELDEVRLAAEEGFAVPPGASLGEYLPSVFTLQQHALQLQLSAAQAYASAAAMTQPRVAVPMGAPATYASTSYSGEDADDDEEEGEEEEEEEEEEFFEDTPPRSASGGDPPPPGRGGGVAGVV